MEDIKKANFKGKNKKDINSCKNGKQQFGLRFEKAVNFSDWYTDLIVKSDMIEYYSIRGCYILKPTSMFLWNEIKSFFDKEIKKLKVKEVYFPSLVTKESLEKESNHVEGFAPELAWITKAGDQDIQAIALRPTSETIIYPSFAKWIQSHRDLPLKVNQWCNVFRWEVKSTTPFIRSREFLWQEGHTAHYTQESAEKEVFDILDLYKRVYEELLAVPVIKGKKTEGEKFSGAEYTTSLEAFIPESGRAVQAATSHFLGQNFSKMFDIKVEDIDIKLKLNDLHIERSEEESLDLHRFVYQNSWGLTTRSIGISIMLHGDDKGLVLPPKIAPIQVVIIPCGLSNKVDCTPVYTACKRLLEELENVGLRVEYDDRTNITPGFKFMHHELQGVPFRVEIGFKDIENKTCRLKRRFDGKTEDIDISGAPQILRQYIDKLHTEMLELARIKMEQCRELLDGEDNTFQNFLNAVNNKKFVLAKWCNVMECEEDIRKKSTVVDKNGTVVLMGAKSLCIPYMSASKQISGTCVNCEREAKVYCLFGRSY